MNTIKNNDFEYQGRIVVWNGQRRFAVDGFLQCVVNPQCRVCSTNRTSYILRELHPVGRNEGGPVGQVYRDICLCEPSVWKFES